MGLFILMKSFIDLPTDIVQYIALMNDPCDYLNIALTCKHFSGILNQTRKHPRRAKAIRHFTRLSIDRYGHKKWILNGMMHRDDDEPARIDTNGYRMWFQYGIVHRDNDEPAAIFPCGSKMWFKNGKIYRDNDKPAVVWSDGVKEWWIEGTRIQIK